MPSLPPDGSPHSLAYGMSCLTAPASSPVCLPPPCPPQNWVPAQGTGPLPHAQTFLILLHPMNLTFLPTFLPTSEFTVFISSSQPPCDVGTIILPTSDEETEAQRRSALLQSHPAQGQDGVHGLCSRPHSTAAHKHLCPPAANPEASLSAWEPRAQAPRFSPCPARRLLSVSEQAFHLHWYPSAPSTCSPPLCLGQAPCPNVLPSWCLAREGAQRQVTVPG